MLLEQPLRSAQICVYHVKLVPSLKRKVKTKEKVALGTRLLIMFEKCLGSRLFLIKLQI